MKIVLIAGTKPPRAAPPHYCLTCATLPFPWDPIVLTETSQDEGQLPSEGEDQSSDEEEHLSPRDEGQSYFENEQQPFPGTWGEIFTQDLWQSFECDLCLESFLTTETLEMVILPRATRRIHPQFTLKQHTRFAHRWTCGYCRDKPLFLSFSLWREVSAWAPGSFLHSTITNVGPPAASCHNPRTRLTG